MPSSSFIVNSEFQPMSYQELLHPVLTQTQYLRELDEKYTQLDLQADKLEQLANSAVDLASYERYKSFANRLREEAGNLARYGLRGRDNARFMELFRSYGKEIQPLLDALQKRERLIAMQLQLSMQDPTSLYDRSAGNISLEELMSNPSAAPVRQSGELLRALASAMATNLLNELRQATFGKTKTPGYLAFTLKYGLSSADVAAFVSNPNNPSANKVLRAIYDLVMTSSGVKENWEGDAYNRASQYVGMGLWNAIGKSAVQPLTDNVYMANLNFAHQKALQDANNAAALRRQREAQYHASREALKQRDYNNQLMLQQAALAAGKGIPTNVTGTLTKDLIEKRRADLNKYVAKKYIVRNKNGEYKITDLGMKALFDRNTKYTTPVYGHGVLWGTKVGEKEHYKNFDAGFYDFMKNTGMITVGALKTYSSTMENGKRVNKIGRGIDRNTISKNINNFYTQNEMGFDLNWSPQLRSVWGEKGAGLMKSALGSVSDDTLKKLGTDRKKVSDGYLNWTDVNKDGMVMQITDSDGKVVRVPVGADYNPAMMKTITEQVKQNINIGNLLKEVNRKGMLPAEINPDGTVKSWTNQPASKSDKENWQYIQQTQLLNQALPLTFKNIADIYVPLYDKAVEMEYYSPYQASPYPTNGLILPNGIELGTGF